jgi:integrase
VTAGLGKEGGDALAFQRPDGSADAELSYDRWRRLVRTLKLSVVPLHAGRHIHVSQLNCVGYGNVLTISRRLGHGSPSITLDVYVHLFHATDDQAANVFEAAFGQVARK